MFNTDTGDPAAAGALGDKYQLFHEYDIVKTAKIGDVVAYKRDYSDASGHVVVYAGTTGRHVVELRALAVSDRWADAISLTLRPLRKSVRVTA